MRARTPHTRAESHTSPFPKAVCIHFTHAAQKKGGGVRGWKQRYCVSAAHRQLDSSETGASARSSGAIQVLRRHLRGARVHFTPAVSKRASPLRSIRGRTRDSGVKARTDAVPGSASTSRSVPFRSVHLHLFRSGCGAPLVCLRVSSASPYLLHPSLSLCFPTVIDSSLQSLTAAHQHLLRGDRETCMSTGERVARLAVEKGSRMIPS